MHARFHRRAFVALSSPAAADDFAKFAAFEPASAVVVDHAKWAAFLSAYLRPQKGDANLVAYKDVSAADRAALASYIDDLEAVRPTTLNRDEAFAYWVNLYNAVTVSQILDHYPVKSIRDIKSGLFSFGPWDKKIATVDGASLSLNDIEHKILRPYFADNRVHYAVNCASLGCPDLKPTPWTSAGLNADLDAAARTFINSSRGVRFEGGRLVASSIYKWYAEDFGATEANVLKHLAKYAAPHLTARLERATAIDAYEYDWRLIEAK
jgi:hypothetical protein